MGIYCLQERISNTLKQYNKNIAIEQGNRLVSYEELRKKTVQLCTFFSEQIKTTNAMVGILLDDRVSYVEIIIALLKAGHVIVPLYSGYPTERLKSMMKAAELSYLMIDECNRKRFIEEDIAIDIPVIWDVEAVYDGLTEYKVFESTSPCNQEEPAYIHFTSGTTGEPKGVLGKSKSLCHYMEWLGEEFLIGVGSRVSQFAIPGFDPFLKETVGTILAGGTVCIPMDLEILKEHVGLKDWIEDSKITHIHCVSSLFRLLNNNRLKPSDFSELRYILLAGEKINPADLKTWYQTFDERIQLVNCYGPTETTMSKVFYYIKKEDVDLERIPVGKPMKGAQVLILNDRMQLCDTLEPGEIYIRTPYRSLGYCNAKELTAEKFIPNPFHADDLEDWIYKTGDLGRYLTDGSLDILGRADRQVKIHGYRIELEEIETAILQCSDQIYEAVVMKKEMSEYTAILSAYISLVDNENSEKDIKDKITSALKHTLPEYMIPTSYTFLERIPRNQRGKVDYKELEQVPIHDATNFVPPENEVQRRLISIWEKILGVPNIGIDDNFIKLGGNSLNVISLVSGISNEFQIRLPLGVVFKNTTVRKLAQVLSEQMNEREAESDEETLKVTEDKCYDLSYEQKSIWVLSKIQEQSTYNIPFKLEVMGDFNITAAENAVNQIMKKHTILRTVFTEENGLPRQKIITDMNFSFHVIDKKGCEKAAQTDEIDERIEEELNYRFDLEAGPMLRGIVFCLAQQHYIVFLNIYHIVFDGYSMGVFAKDFSSYYNQQIGKNSYVQEEEVFQYAAYAELQQKAIESGKMQKHRDYWMEQLRDITDVSNSSSPSKAGEEPADYYEFTVDRALELKVIKTAETMECTKFMVLLSSYFLLLHKLTYEEDIVIGVPFNNREEEHLKDAIGFYVNTLPIRVKFKQLSTFKDLIREVKQLCIHGYTNVYPFNKLVSELNPERNADTSPYFSTIFIFHNNPIELDMEGLEVKVKEFLVKNAKHDYKLDMQELAEGLNGRFEYRRNKLQRSSIEAMKNEYIRLLDQMTSNEEGLLRDIFHTEQLEMGSMGTARLD